MRREMILVKALVALVGLFLLSTSIVWAGPPAPVEKTGQTTKYATGDDGDYEKGVAWPNPRFTDNGDLTVTDNLTGLMWTKDAELFGALPWSKAIAECEALELGFNGCNIRTDWRLPNRFELESLMHLGYYDPALPNTAGTGKWSAGDPMTNMPQFPYYWSSTTYAPGALYAWAVYMFDGSVGMVGKDTNYYAWPVRGGK